MSGSFNHSGPPHGAKGEGPGMDGKPGGHLPPPAFPPGTRRVQLRRRMESPGAPGAPDEPEVSDIESAFISPDDPMPERRGGFESALISPDDPMPERSASQGASGESPWTSDGGTRLTASRGARPDADEDEVVVTGIGSDAHLDPVELALGGDPHVREVADAVKKLAAALQQKGEGGLRTTPEMSRFEAQLRSYCVGYLAGRRAEDQEV